MSATQNLWIFRGPCVEFSRPATCRRHKVCGFFEASNMSTAQNLCIFRGQQHVDGTKFVDFSRPATCRRHKFGNVENYYPKFNGDAGFFLKFREKKRSCDFFDMTALSALILALKLANFAILAKNSKKMHFLKFFACSVKSTF